MAEATVSCQAFSVLLPRILGHRIWPKDFGLWSVSGKKKKGISMKRHMPDFTSSLTYLLAEAHPCIILKKAAQCSSELHF